MTISATYIQMQQQIADEVGDRQDLLAPLSDSGLALSPIQNAIQSAISKWEREPYYFLDSYQTLFTTNGNIPAGYSGQEFYTSVDAPAIATSPRIVQLRVLTDDNRYTMTPRTWSYIEDISVNPNVTSSYPSDWAYRAEQIRLYPIPSQVMPVQATYDPRLTNLVNSGDTNVWTQDAFDLIRSEAKLILAREVLHDASLAAESMMAIYGSPQNPRERGYLRALKGENTRRSSGRRVRATYF